MGSDFLDQIRKQPVKSAAVLCLIVGILVNSTTSWRSYLATAIDRAWQLRGLDNHQRAAAILEGSQFGEFIAFLRGIVPEDARVILPPRNPPIPEGHVGLMQYFLFPRDIHNCGINEVPECVLRATGENTYILAVPGFPPPALAELHKEFVQFREDRGVYVPLESAADGGS